MMTFYEWLCLQSELDGPIGDLARDAMRGRYRPQENTYGVWHYRIKHACQSDADILAAFEEAWQGYQRHIAGEP